MCVCVIRLRSVSVAPPPPRSCYIYPQAPTYKHCSHVIPLQSCPPRKPCLFHTHTSYSFTTTCHSAHHTESPLQQCSSVTPHITLQCTCMRKHKQLLNCAGQSMHTNTPHCILDMNFDTHLKRDPCVLARWSKCAFSCC